MTLKHLKENTWTIEQANQHVKQDFDKKYWQFLIRLINYKEVKWDAKNHSIIFAEYIPLKTLIEEVLERILTEEEFMVEQCQECHHYFDVNNDEGIFGDTEALAHFICKKCAHSLTAWQFYHKHLKT